MGGSIHQRLAKNSATNYDTAWYGPYEFNVCDYGADPTAASPSDTAFSNAAAAGVATGGRFKIKIPAGTYQLTTQWSFTLPNQSAGFTIEGDGPGTTVLRWNSGSGSALGLNVAFNSSQGQLPGQSPFDIHGISWLTQAGFVGTAITFTGLPDSLGVGFTPNIIRDCNFDEDGSGGHWSQMVSINNPQWCYFLNIAGVAQSGILCTVTGGTPLDGLWFENCNIACTSGHAIDLEGGSGGYQFVIIKDSSLIASADVVKFSASAGSEVLYIHDCYLNIRSTGWALNSSGMNRIWFHDTLIDGSESSSSPTGGITISGSEQIKIHDVVFYQGAGTSLSIATTPGGMVHNNEFVSAGTDISLASGASSIHFRSNDFTNGGTTNAPRAAVVSNSGTGNLFDNVPVLISALPSASVSPVGFRALVSNGSPVFTGTVSATGSTESPVYNDGSNWRYG